MTQGSLGIAEADEPHHTFIENALAKARHAAPPPACAAIADDSGLCVDALGGAPGVISAHYAGEVGLVADEDREARRRRAGRRQQRRCCWQRLQRGHADRRAHFVSTLVAVRHADDPEPLVAVGRWPGQVLEALRGAQGFGYDPLMFIPALGCTVAEMDAALKNAAQPPCPLGRRSCCALLRAGMAPVTQASVSLICQPICAPARCICSEPPPLSLYVHLPWCLKKCPYCDFNSHARPSDGLPEQRYLDALVADLEAALPQVWGRRVVSVFIGGGTPSLFSPDGIDRLLADIRARLPLQPGCRDHAGSQPRHLRA